MTLKRLIILFVIALAGYLACALLFRGTHPAVRMRQSVDRRAAIEIARQEAKRQDFAVGTGMVGVETTLQRNSDYYLRGDANPSVSPYLSSTSSVVTLRQSASRTFKVTVANDGRILGWERNEPKPKQTVTLSADEARVKATEAAGALAGPALSRFVSDEVGVGSGPSRYSWKLEDPQEPRVKLVATVDIDNGAAVKASLNPVFSTAYLDSIRALRRIVNALTVSFALLILLGMLISLFYYVRNIVNKEIRHRSTFIFFGWMFVFVAIWTVGSGLFTDIYFGLSGTTPRLDGALGIALTGVVMTLLTLLFAAPVILILGAGFPYSARQPANPLRGLEILLRGNLFARVTGSNVFTGLALGWIFPVVALLISKSGFFERAQLRSPDQLAEMVAAPLPLLAPPTEIAIITFYVFSLLYLLLVPVASSYLRRPVLVRSAAILVGAFCLISTVSFQSSVAASCATALALLVLLDQLTFRIDVVAAITSIVAADFAIRLCTLVAQPALSLHNSGLRGWALLVGAGLVTGYIALRGRELTESELRPVWTTEEHLANRVDRDRLKAEFDVARRAQQQMLPDQSPTFPGFEISAVCRPAREVGGDLYDFILFEDDRVGIVVADVSGKGVPASLYMTLTKGLLASVAEATSDPGEILREVNRHLYIACGKKMFVTLLLGIVDTSKRTFSYARAGHNPPVWRRAAEEETRLLRAKGLGLGLNSGEVFNRTLVVETIRLESRDKLVLYSDGITEAMNGERVEYGEERLMEIAARSDALNAEEMRDAILKDVSDFLGTVPPQDDQTLVVLQVA